MQKYKLQATGTPTPEFLNASRNIFFNFRNILFVEHKTAHLYTIYLISSI